MAPTLRLVALTCNAHRQLINRAIVHPMDVDDVVVAGRFGDVQIGVDPDDGGISRQALTVSPTRSGWRLRLTNRNGGVVYKWGQAAALLVGDQPTVIRWPRVGIRLLGTVTDLHHWVFLEADRYALADVRQSDFAEGARTALAPPPAALTPAQHAALVAVFAEHLAWPPFTGPVPVALETVGRRLGVSYAAVVQRLEGARQRAYRLGGHQQFGVSEPDYLYTLVAHGYLSTPTLLVNEDDPFHVG